MVRFARASFAAVTLVVGLGASVAGADPKPAAIGQLVMDGHDGGHLMYADKCSNGANSDDAGRDKFVAAMQADKKSKLARTMAELATKFTEADHFEVVLGDWFETYHLRDGCGETSIGMSAPILVRSTMGNSHELWTKYLVTIDDDVSADRRAFKLRSIVPLAMREH